MKKSQLIKLIKEEITKLANLKEQGGGIRVRLRSCQGGIQQYKCVPQGSQLGDRFTANIGVGQTPRQTYIKAFLGGTCPMVHSDLTAPQGPCPNCENEDPQQFSCAAQSTGGCDPNGPFPGNFNLQSWTNTWTSLPNFSSNNPNQPCNFVCQRKNLWTNQLASGGMGPVQTNMVECKLAEANNQYQIHNCATSNANNCP